MTNVSRGLERIIRSTACWRGYVATWSLDKGRLFLVRAEGRYRLDGAEPLLADWFTGVLRVPRGETLVGVNMGFGSVHESELHIKIASGVVVASRTVDNRGRTYDRHELAMRSLPGARIASLVTTTSDRRGQPGYSHRALPDGSRSS